MTYPTIVHEYSIYGKHKIACIRLNLYTMQKRNKFDHWTDDELSTS